MRYSGLILECRVFMTDIVEGRRRSPEAGVISIEMYRVGKIHQSGSSLFHVRTAYLVAYLYSID